MFLVTYLKKKSKKRLSIFLIISIASLSSMIVFLCSHATYYKYNDWWIIGRSISEIESKYGEFDFGEYKANTSGKVGYYIYTDDGPIMPDHLKHYYYIEYDNEGIANKVYDACQIGG
ncbi:MAG: hypothetical protein K2N51_19340 [Lachnospiraceae bacterium]|nr:hypothetical protein [Lachnospiraceae bacterium]